MKQNNLLKFSRSSKGQAAIEFLTTYGWMFMVVLAVFGGLVYFGFADAKEKIPESCRFNELFECKAYYANEGGSYAVEIKNIGSRQINVTRFICGFPQTDTLVRNNYDDPVFDPGDTRVYYCSPASIVGLNLDLIGKELFSMKLVYEPLEQSPIPVVVDGELIAQASDDVALLTSYQDAAALLNLLSSTPITP